MGKKLVNQVGENLTIETAQTDQNPTLVVNQQQVIELVVDGNSYDGQWNNVMDNDHVLSSKRYCKGLVEYQSPRDMFTPVYKILEKLTGVSMVVNGDLVVANANDMVRKILVMDG